MKNIIDFLAALQQNNNREWFEDNKAWYREVRGEFDGFVARLIDGIAAFDSTVGGLAVKDCTYRIYRDTRFSKNKEPYKTYMGAYVCRNGKKSGYAGYYFHIEPSGKGVVGRHLLSAGIYLPEPDVLKSIREEICDNGQRFTALIKRAKGFRLSEDSKLSRYPLGFPQDSSYAEYLKLKDVYLEKFMEESFLTAPGLLENTLKEFRTTVGFVALLNRAVDFVRGER